MARNLSSQLISAARSTSGWAATFAKPWGWTQPAPAVRWMLAALSTVSVLVAGLLLVTGELHGGWAVFVSTIATNAGVLLTSWHPPAGAIALVLFGVPPFLVGQSGGHLTALVACTGLIVYSCSTAVALFYSAAVAAWIIIVLARPPGLDADGVIALFVIGLLSASVGRGVSLVMRRNRVLRETIDSHQELIEAELHAERQRIADELHDVIAHDIAIVAMHARVLDRTTDPGTRAVSQRAIVEGASNALADTRRVLRLIHGRTDEAPPMDRVEDIREAVTRLATKLSDLGDRVEVSIEDGPEPSRFINATLVRAAREAVTNIVRHAPAPRTVAFSLTYPRDSILLSITNNPHEADASRMESSGLGLARIRERIELLDGWLKAGPEGSAWCTRVSVPLR